MTVSSTVERKPAVARRPKRPAPPTSIAFATVTAVERFRPRVQRITLRSDEFGGFLCAYPDQFITFLFPTGDRKQPAIDRSFTWDDWFALPEDQRPHSRNYTVRAYRPELAEVDVDVVLHGDKSIGSAWAIEAEPGDAMAIWGPRTAYDPPSDVEWMLLAGDDTAVPAACVIAESLPASCAVKVILEVHDPDDVQPIVSRGQLDVTWLFRGESSGKVGQQLIDVVRALEIPNGVTYAWGGGEMRAMNAIGRHLRRERGFKTRDVSMTGYWHDDRKPHG